MHNDELVLRYVQNGNKLIIHVYKYRTAVQPQLTHLLTFDSIIVYIDKLIKHAWIAYI